MSIVHSWHDNTNQRLAFESINEKKKKRNRAGTNDEGADYGCSNSTDV